MSDASSRSWADIPQELAEEIASKTFLIDQIRCRAVCKNWSRIRKDIGVTGRLLPCIMLYQLTPKDPICKLYDPLYRKTYLVHLENLCGFKKSEEKRGSSSLTEFRDRLEYCGSKNGWAFFGWDWGSQLAIYNLFTHEVVKLPELDECFTDIAAVTFSSSTPKSSDCLFFALLHFKTYGVPFEFSFELEFSFATCHLADHAWKTTKLGFGRGDVRVRGMIYLDGNVYCLFDFGSLGVYNVDTEEWRMLKVRTQEEKLFGRSVVLVEREGELLLYDANDGDDNWEVAMFDFSRMDWVRKDAEAAAAAGLGDVAVFFSDNSSFWIPAEGEARGLGNTVSYYAHDHRYSCYNVSGRNSLPHSHPYFELYSNVAGLENDGKLEKMWIMPPQI